MRLELDGFPPHELRLNNTLNPLFLLNVLWWAGAPYAMGIDLVTGAWDDWLEPSGVRFAFNLSLDTEAQVASRAAPSGDSTTPPRHGVR